MPFSGHSIEGNDPADHIPRQKPPPEHLPAETRVFVSSFPPLSQVTIADSRPGPARVSFVVCLDVHHSRAQSPWQVALCRSPLGEDSSWTQVLLHACDPGAAPLPLHASDPSVSRLFFALSSPIQDATRFTIRFRESPEEPWRSARDELDLDDGLVLPRTLGTPNPKDLRDVIAGLGPDVAVSPATSQCPGTSLWAIKVPVAGISSGDDRSVFADVELGLPWGGFLRWFALARPWSPWIAPSHGRSDFSSLDKDAVLCSFLSSAGKHLVLLAVSGVAGVTAVLRSNDAGRLVVCMRNDSVQASTATVLAAVGDDFESANAAVMYHARGLVQVAAEEEDLPVGLAEDQEGQDQGPTTRHGQDGPRPEWMENWYDGLGFCTWNALGQRLTEAKLLAALDVLADNQITVSNLIIDDNWQNIDYHGDGQFQYGWNGFEAEPTAFPSGLKATVSAIRSKHPGIHHVAVWHALLGYWGGISPSGLIARSYQTVRVLREPAERRNLPLGGPMTVVAGQDIGRFYDDFYRFLSSCGVDSVKTDAQFIADSWLDAGAHRDLAPEYLDAWSVASLRHFGGRAISCMSQTPRILFYSQLPRNRPAMLLRNSDDFFPDVSSSHPWHVWTNAHNSLLTQHLNIIPDWDMFQTSHDYSEFHAAARCLSGGPIYITDVPGEHDTALIAQMTGTTPRGKTVIFRPSVCGKSIDQYVGYTDDSLLKIGCYHGTFASGNSMLGVFNMSLRPLGEIVPLVRFPGTRPSVTYVVRSHKTGLVTPPIVPESSRSLLALSLEVRGYDILSAFALSTLEPRGSAPVSVANMGLLGKMAGAAAIVSSTFTLVNGRILLETRVKALGVIGLYVSTLAEMSVADDFIATIQGSVIPPDTVSVSKHDNRVLAVDCETAWKQMGLNGGWSNEIELKVYIGPPRP